MVSREPARWPFPDVAVQLAKHRNTRRIEGALIQVVKKYSVVFFPKLLLREFRTGRIVTIHIIGLAAIGMVKQIPTRLMQGPWREGERWDWLLSGN